MSGRRPPKRALIVDRLEPVIGRSGLRAGDRLPSIRTLSAAFGVGPSTVFEAYLELEARGRVVARAKSGFFLPAVQAQPLRSDAPAIPHLPAEPTPQEVLDVLVGAGNHPQVLALDSATPSSDLLPERALRAALVRTARATRKAMTPYLPPPGDAQLRRQVASRLLQAGVDVGADEVVITAGATEALQLSLSVTTQPGDVIAAQSPTYYGLLPIAQSLGVGVVEIRGTTTEGLCLSSLSRALAEFPIRAVFAMPNLSNPTGTSMSEGAKRALVELLTRKRIPLVEDDVYRELLPEAERARPAKAYDTEGLVLLCSSFSKCLAPGFRVGWMVPGGSLRRVVSRQWVTSIAPNTLGQRTLAEFLGSRAFDRHLKLLRRCFHENVELGLDSIRRHFPDGTQVAPPRGGFILWVELPPSVDSMELYRQALAAGVAVMPGPLFSARAEFKNFIRLCLGIPWGPKVERGLAQVGAIATQMAREH